MVPAFATVDCAGMKAQGTEALQGLRLRGSQGWLLVGLRTGWGMAGHGPQCPALLVSET